MVGELVAWKLDFSSFFFGMLFIIFGWPKWPFISTIQKSKLYNLVFYIQNMYSNVIYFTDLNSIQIHILELDTMNKQKKNKRS